ncbi:hypothetical protein [Aeromicrobium sp. UC242_57]|uniref:hypothetical protein n=1 Tax=Aeromicrobium sp. UC242_57 TaxID=3374624 RepID=UPI00378D02EE
MTEMNPTTTCARILLLSALVLAAGCGSEDDDTAALCSSVDSLKTSVSGLTDITIDKNALTDLQARLDQVQTDLGEVKDDASDKYATEIDAVDQAASTVGSTLDQAISTPSVQAASAVGTAVQSLGTSLKTLADAVKGTC